MLNGFLGISLKFLKLFLNYAKGIFRNFPKIIPKFKKCILGENCAFCSQKFQLSHKINLKIQLFSKCVTKWVNAEKN